VSKRLRDPALDIDELPPVNAVVLSHMHGDHWDRVAQGRLDKAVPILTTPHAAKRLAHREFGHSVGLQTWQQHTIVHGATTVTVTSLPGRHAPTPIDRFLPPVMGSMLEFTDGSARSRSSGKAAGSRPPIRARPDTSSRPRLVRRGGITSWCVEW
jgi:L-ascorbate metabolism protein UlaG (beta-lactamase superfamily)